MELELHQIVLEEVQDLIQFFQQLHQQEVEVEELYLQIEQVFQEDQVVEQGVEIKVVEQQEQETHHQ